MRISKETVKYIAELSKLDIPLESDDIINELNAFVGYMDILNSVNTDGVEPLSHIFPLSNIMREDVVCDSYSSELILENAAVKNEATFIVPKTVE